jgi:hypothetical protein
VVSIRCVAVPGSVSCGKMELFLIELRIHSQFPVGPHVAVNGEGRDICVFEHDLYR